MTPATARASLDSALARNGKDALLIRNTLGPGGSQIPVSVKVRVFATGYQPHELISGSGIVQGDTKVVMSFTEIEAAQWPGSTPTNFKGDRRVPIKGDVIMLDGRPTSVQGAAVRPLDSGLVVQVRG